MVTELSAALAIALLVNPAKALIEQWIGTTGELHDAVIRLLALFIGVVGFIVHDVLTGTLTGPLVWNDAQDGLVASVAAIATYHLLNASNSSSSDPPSKTTTPTLTIATPSTVTSAS